MSTSASLLFAIGRWGGAVVESPAAPWQLSLLAESIRLAAPPTFFAVWQDGPESMRLFVDVLIQAGLTTPHVIRPDNLAAKLVTLGQRSWTEDDGVIFLGCLSAMPEEEGKRFNAGRDRLLGLPTRIIFVESVADERKIRLAYPDVLSQVSYDCRLFLRAGEQDPFVTSDGQRQGSGPNGESPTALSGTVHEVRDDDAVCWLEVGLGTLVKFAVPLPLLRHLDPQPGLEFLWSPGNEREAPAFWKRQPEPPDPSLLREFEELSRRFHEDLKHRKRRSPKDVKPSHE